MTIRRLGFRRTLLATALTGALLSALAAPHATARDSSEPQRPGPRPTIVLVHGAFADASSWSAVVERLQGDGYQVVAPANPLRGLSTDAAYLASFLNTIHGPIILVGHSYGGAVVTQAAAGDKDVKALVFVSAFMPDEGETLGDLNNKFPGSQLNPALIQVPFDNGTGKSGTDVYIDHEKFRHVFAADLDPVQSAVLAASQRPVSATAFTDKTKAAAWRTIPSWALVAKEDRTIAPDLERFEAKRANSHTVEVNSSHVAPISHPDAVTRLIDEAAVTTAP